MDPTLLWEIIGSVAGVVAVPTGIAVGVIQTRQARKGNVTPALSAKQGARPQSRVFEIGPSARPLLGIHPAIPLLAGSEAGLSPELPTYVERDIDSEFRSWLEAKKETGGFAVIVGPSTSGKTRTAYEAVAALLSDWHLLVPESAPEIEEALAAGSPLGKTIIWLNDIEKFLLVDQGLTADTLRRLLSIPDQPVIVIGTIWASRHDELTSFTNRNDMGVYRDAREILAILATRFDLVTRFSDSEWQRINLLAANDPRLLEVCKNRDDGNPTELLAAVPELIHRWRHASEAYGTAVLSGAIAMRRCGVPEPLGIHLLATIANLYLTPVQRASASPSWQNAALDWACIPVRGDIAPISRVASSVGHIDGVIVSDVLLQNAEVDPTPPGGRVPDEVWEICIEQTSGSTLASVGIAAFHSGRPQYADTALSRSAETNPDASTLVHLGILAERGGNDSRAEELWRRASETGACCAFVNLARLLTERGDVDEAEALIVNNRLQKHGGAAHILGWIADIRGQSDAAQRWWNKSAEEGDTQAIRELGNQAANRGDTANAIDWFTKAADLGDGCSMDELGQLAEREARLEEAEEWFERAIANGCSHAPVSLALLIVDRGDEGAARARELCLTVDNNRTAMFVLGHLAAGRGDDLEAEEWWHKAAELGLGCSMDKLGHRAESQGNSQEAISWWEKAVDTGCHHALVSLGRSKFVCGETAEAKELLLRAAQTGDQDAARYLKDFGLT